MVREQTFDRVEIARALGHDLYRWRLPCGDEMAAVQEGHASARAAWVARRPADRFVRKWLQLRASALRRDRVVDDDVTPALLRDIDVDRCPVTRVVLTHAELAETDWSVDRLNNDGAYAASNLAVMSTRANRAKGSKSYDEVFSLSQFAAPADGLTPVEWLRLAVVMLGPCFALQPMRAPSMPLCAPMPNHSARPVTQHVQHVFTQAAQSQAGKNTLIREFKATATSDRSLARLRLFAEALHQGLKHVDDCHDAWLDVRVMDSFLAWKNTMDVRRWALAGEISRQWAGSRVLPPARLAAWHLESRGYRA